MTTSLTAFVTLYFIGACFWFGIALVKWQEERVNNFYDGPPLGVRKRAIRLIGTPIWPLFVLTSLLKNLRYLYEDLTSTPTKKDPKI